METKVTLAVVQNASTVNANADGQLMVEGITVVRKGFANQLEVNRM
ncbi:hypothetical protein [Cohnella abietis]|uniref:Uncharacterized protein n=1 Tax=Cohnella abietis TaxID=2507935 RepID=A0A3T1D394_9BACL|nr:hypothetical protein [Cohnella abietis]BBI32580.1 hypothetical protein KCTCHS21_19790 [Cohnella abietis]